jgi:PAT family acetyl-CoA transporter-like MFS transporter 1
MNGNQDDDSKEALLPGEGERKHNSRGLAGDWGSIALLSLLYTLQGIPMGLSGSIPLLLAKKGVVYTNGASIFYYNLITNIASSYSIFSIFIPQWATRTKQSFLSARGLFH